MTTTGPTTLTDLAAEVAERHDLTEDAARAAVDTYVRQLMEADGAEAVLHDTATLTATAADDVRGAVAAEYVPGHVSRHEQTLGDAVDAYRAATVAAEDARADRDAAIRASLAGGMTHQDVQTVTGLSRAMVYGIRQGLTRLS